MNAQMTAFMEWDMRDIYKRPVPLAVLWWPAFTWVWDMIAREYVIDVLLDAAEGRPLTFPHVPEFRAECKAYLDSLRIK